MIEHPVQSDLVSCQPACLPSCCLSVDLPRQEKPSAKEPDKTYQEAVPNEDRQNSSRCNIEIKHIDAGVMSGFLFVCFNY